MKFVTQFNGEFKKQFEKKCGPSLTVPDEAMSVAELIRRQAAGLPLGGAKVPLYDEDDDSMLDIESMDMAERQEMLEMYNNVRKAQQRSKVERITGEEVEQSEKVDPDPNNPKNTRGAGAEPRNEEKGGNHEK